MNGKNSKKKKQKKTEVLDKIEIEKKMQRVRETVGEGGYI